MKVKNENNGNKVGSGEWVRRLRRGFAGAVVVVMVGTSDAWAASGDGGMAQAKSFADHLANYVTAIAATVESTSRLCGRWLGPPLCPHIA